jgi:homoserine kinase
LMRLLGRPIGLSGSGPTLWALYPSLDEAAAAAETVRAALDGGTLAIVAPDPPFVTATTMTSSRRDP